MSKTNYPACFKAYDIRGRVPDELNEDLAGRVGRAFAELRSPKKVVVGRDIRLSSDSLAEALIEGFLASGVDVIDIGLGGTEMVYFGAMHLEHEGVDGGVVVTASHNPADYNGMKLVQRGARPISGDTGLHDIGRKAVELAGAAEPSGPRGTRTSRDIMAPYVEHMLSYVDVAALKPLKVVANPGNGGAGLVIDALEKHLPFTFHKVHHTPDGSFPNGVPNPLLEENRAPTSEAVRNEGADVGLAWDGDFDRCFFFDEEGAFVDGYYMVGLLAAAMLERSEGAAIIHDPRLVWNTVEMVKEKGGRPVVCKTGHAFIKERMRIEDAVYGGEMSAHHYFRDFAYCDSGMIPWLLVLEIMSRSGLGLKELVAARKARFPASGEINRRIKDPDAAIAAVRGALEKDAGDVDETDGLSLAFDAWRLNIRKSNTEPVLRLNIESRGDESLMRSKTEEVLSIIDRAGGGAA